MPLSLEPTSLQILCDAITDGVIMTDGADRVCFVNEAACRLLGTSAEDLMGLSSHNVFLSHLKATPAVLPRLRAGEVVTCGGSGDDPEALQVQRCALPQVDAHRAPLSEEVPTAILVRDRRPAQRLRELEDVMVGRPALRLRSNGHPPCYGHTEIMRALEREVARAHRDGEPLSIVVVQCALDANKADLAELLSSTLRGSDHAGVMQTGSGAVQLDPYAQWGMVVLPAVGEAGARAVEIRLRALAAGLDVGEARFGTATLRQQSAGWLEKHREGAGGLLARALTAWSVERRLHGGLAESESTLVAA